MFRWTPFLHLHPNQLHHLFHSQDPMVEEAAKRITLTITQRKQSLFVPLSLTMYVKRLSQGLRRRREQERKYLFTDYLPISWYTKYILTSHNVKLHFLDSGRRNKFSMVSKRNRRWTRNVLATPSPCFCFVNKDTNLAAHLLYVIQFPLHATVS